MSAPAYELDGAPVDPVRFYACACDPSVSVVVEACAGAGKTWMLVSRIVRALLTGAEPQQVLAITFTRKAAGEMRQRLDEWLQQWAQAPRDGVVRELRMRGLAAPEAEAAAPALQALHARLLAGGRRVEVLTFHAWFSQLLAQAPLATLRELGLPAQHELLEDTARCWPELRRVLWRRLKADAALGAAYQALVQRHGRDTVDQWLFTAWLRGPELQRADAAGTFAPSVPAAVDCFPEGGFQGHPGERLLAGPVADALRALARVMGASANKTPRDAAEGLAQALEQSDPARALELARDALFTKGEPRKRMGEPAGLDEALAEIRLTELYARQHEAHLDHSRLVPLARVLLTEWAALKRRRGWVDMPDLERAAEALLGDPALAGWMQERLDLRLRHVLIDEFQDTSPLQWQVLEGWLGSYAGAGGGASGQRPLSVFIVGDPKQSIYRFRGAESRVFAAAQAFVAEGLGGHRLACDHTRRNARAVIEAVNAVFGEAAADGGWGPFRPHTTASDLAGAVWCLPPVPRPEKPAKAESGSRSAAGDEPLVWRDSLTEPRHEPVDHQRDLEAAAVARAVRALIVHEGLAPGEIMVLARQRSALAAVADALAAAGVPHAVAEKQDLADSPEAQDLAAVVEALVSPRHALALARALRSPLFDASDDDLLALAQAAGKRSWLAALPRVAAGRPALERAAALFARWRAVAPALTPHDLLDRVLHDTDGLARIAARVPPARLVQALHAVRALLAATLAHQRGQWPSAYAWLRAFKAGQLRAGGVAVPGAVQLLTVHGAKGLEARAVVLVDTDPELRPGDIGNVLLDWPVHTNAPRLAALLRSLREPPPTLEAVVQAQARLAEAEELNMLYVAMTRARERLVISSKVPFHGVAGRSWWSRLQARAVVWQPPPVPGTEGAALGPTGSEGLDLAEVSVPCLPPWRAEQAVDAEVDTARTLARDDEAARRGQAVHRVLEWATQGRAAEAAAPARRVHWCRAACRQFAVVGEGEAVVAAAVDAMLDSAALQPLLFGPGIVWAGNEVPLDDAGQALRLDRLVARQAGAGVEWWVLDYKLSWRPEHQAEYRLQLARYRDRVAALQPGQVVRAAFVTGRGEVVPLD